MTVILKRTRAPPKDTKDGTVQAEMEDGAFEYIQNLRSKNKILTTLIISRKLVKYIQCLKVG